MCVCVKTFVISLVFLLNIEIVTSVKIIKLSVPPIVDLQEDTITLDCKYDMGAEELYSVKWYKDELEFFRYVPRGTGEQAFEVHGVTVVSQESATTCDSRHCPVVLSNLSRATEGVYRCEILTEAPLFKVFYDTANMTIVALPRGTVKIAHLRTEFSEGDDIFVNCTSPPADPPPKIRWYINDRLMKPVSMISLSDSSPDERGLIVRSLAARLDATRDLFLQNNNLLALRCEVNAPQQLPLHATVYMTMYELKQQTYDWQRSTSSTISLSVCLYILLIFIIQISIS